MRVDVFGVTKPVPTLSRSDRAGLSGLIVNVLKEVMMDGFVMGVIKIP